MDPSCDSFETPKRDLRGHLRVQMQNNKHGWNKRKNFAEILRAKECTRQEKNGTVKKYFILCQNCIKGKYIHVSLFQVF
jgi:hypothetical protein